MTALALEAWPASASSWPSQDAGTAIRSGYRAGSSSSFDFGTVKIAQFQRKSIELSGYQILVNLTSEFADMVSSVARASRTMTVDASLDHPDLERAERRLEYIANLDLSDSFEELEAVPIGALRDAGALLRKLAAVSLGRALPDIGLDGDGTVVFSFHPDRCGIIGSLSIFGDGTYSYCIESEGVSIESGASHIAAPIDVSLQDFLSR